MELRVLTTELQTVQRAAVISSLALDVNNQGVVVGRQSDESGARTPLLWPHAASVPIELPLPEGTAGGELGQ